ncbi:protease pro-enzyme activation domain-containing protein [Kitasatospora sp. NPDC059571]|uniref:S53 family peptidase n=1 Tax=Kitasatospora sp. NPDC059571 TaxID=3346871 RepID=UPI00367B55F1
MSHSQYTTLPDSHRVPRRGASVAGPVNPNEEITVTVYLRRDPGAPPMPDVLDLAMTPPTEREAPTAAQLADVNRASPADVAAVREFAAERNLAVGRVDELARSVELEGTVGDFADAFQVPLARYQYQDRNERWRTYRGRVGSIHVPADLGDVVTGVFGLDNRPIGNSLMTRRPPAATTLTVDEAAMGMPIGTFLPNALDRLYDYPTGTDGSGQTIAVLAFNGDTTSGPSGGYSQTALNTYFHNVLHIDPPPQITNVVVHGPGNEPGGDIAANTDPSDVTIEIMLDLQVIGALAPKAKIVVYFSRFTEQGWVDVINRIVSDHRASVVSCSYGNPEDAPGLAWTASGVTHTDQAFTLAAAGNVSICCASGDNGSGDIPPDLVRQLNLAPRSHADFPASSPHVLGVGGTRLFAQDDRTIAAEIVWDDGPDSSTGGGVSRVFPVPPWQHTVNLPLTPDLPHIAGRGVPDVSGLADPVTGVMILSVDGRTLYTIGGTSAAAPQWSALLARVNQGLGAQVGFLNPLLYTKLSDGVLRDITLGANGAFGSGPGWDACTGFGSPGGQALLDGLRKLG